MKILKFGGQSLANNEGLNQLIQIITPFIEKEEKILIVLSARGKSTSALDALIAKAYQKEDFSEDLQHFEALQKNTSTSVHFKNEINLISSSLSEISNTNTRQHHAENLILAQGELCSLKVVSQLLHENHIQHECVDSRQLIQTRQLNNIQIVNKKHSRKETQQFFNSRTNTKVFITAGYIASDEEGNTTTLGKNGSNYSASLLANFTHADEIRSYTHVDGIYESDPLIFPQAKKIDFLDYESAQKIAHSKAEILHQKCISPLIQKQIPLRILNTFNPKSKGTLIHNAKINSRIKTTNSSLSRRKQINLAIFGLGLVGGSLIEQILTSKTKLAQKKGVDLNIFALANSKKVILKSNGISNNWKELVDTKESYCRDANELIQYTKENKLDNLIAIDATNGDQLVNSYIPLVNANFNVVSANKIANSSPYSFYNELRQQLQNNQKEFLYETNVGAGLPLIDTLKNLHLAGDEVQKIQGVFSGSLSYIFNQFCIEDKSFSEIVKEAKVKGFTEPNPLEDLSGKDVGRKLLILARELDIKKEFSDVIIESLIPQELEDNIANNQFQLSDLNNYFQRKKDQLPDGHCLRYVGELDTKTQQLKVALKTVPTNSALGHIRGSDSLFVIQTASYQDPMIIQGAGAGAQVTARGVFVDILKIVDKQIAQFTN